MATEPKPRAMIHIAILRSAALLVPETQRSAWLAEWRSELWHVQRDPRGQNITAFCIGAFQDAFWLWRDDPRPHHPSLFVDSPARCLSLLAALGALCVAAAFLLPAARSVLRCALYPPDLVMLSPVEAGDPSIQNGFFDPYPTVSRKQFEALRVRSAGQFTVLAFYVPALLPVETPGGKHTLSVARTTADLLRLLNIPVAYSGKSLLVPARAASRWNLPASRDGWLIEDETAFATLPQSTKGYVIARLRHGTLHDSRFRFIRLRERSFAMFWAALLALPFACVFLAVMHPDSSGGRLRRSGPRRALFLVAKALLVLPIVMFGSLDLTSLGSTASPLYFDAVFLCSFFAARWINADQRKRCPVCLRLLANPVRIGESSRILLEWRGTELMCLRGHGLLYVPEWSAIWSGQPQWMHFGPSWSGLF